MSDKDFPGRFDGVEIETAGSVEFAVIWLHGLGADGHDFAPIVPQLSLPRGTRFVFPHAPIRPVTINAGFPMRAWYDIASLDGSGGDDVAGIQASAASLRRLIDREERRGVPPERTVIAGFSQGGAIALYTGLSDARRLAGVLALSTYLPLADSVLERGSPNRSLAVWMGHGRFDPVVPLAMAERSRQQLEEAGIGVEWHAYEMAHSVCAEEISDLSLWLTRRQLLG